MQRTLSEVPGLGGVVMCGACDEVHVSVGRTSFRLPREMFETLARMMADGAARLSEAEACKFNVTFEDGVPSFAPVREG